MGLETATFIHELDSSNPVGGSDNKSQGDDHLRLIKSTLQNSFPNVEGAVSASHIELSFVAGVTSAIQTQLNAKQATITGGATTIASANLTASRALVSDGSGKVVVSNATATDINSIRNFVALRYSGSSETVHFSKNVASVTRHGFGDYTINFNTAIAEPMPFISFIGSLAKMQIQTLSTTSVRINIFNNADVSADVPFVLVIFGPG